MASKRRGGGGGFRPPELRGTLGTLIRTTTGVVRDALERGAREGRARLDDARTSRRRSDALAELGELVLDLIRRGEIDLAELPEARDLVRQLDELDADADEPEPPPPRAVRRRFDDRPPPSRGTGPSRLAADDGRRPRGNSVTGDDDRRHRSSPFFAADRDDGTVSSGVADRFSKPTRPDSSKPETSSTRAPTRPMKTWPPSDAPASSAAPDAPAGPTGSGPTGSGPTGSSNSPGSGPTRRPPLPTGPHRKGGISFDDDDLADYMHPDDVPPKPPTKDPGDHDA